MRVGLKLLMAALIVGAPLILPHVVSAEVSIRQSAAGARCSTAKNDDTTKRFEPSLRSGFVKAYRRLFPDARAAPDKAELSTALFRCMDGHLLACFVGANLPCGKVDVSKTNRGASEFCRENPGSDIVPMGATGHDTIYVYTCSSSKARVKEQNWRVDHRGFAAQLWKPMD